MLIIIIIIWKKFENAAKKKELSKEKLTLSMNKFENKEKMNSVSFER